MHITLALLLFCLLSLANSCRAETSVVVYDIKGLHHADHSGSYDKILLKAKDLGVGVKLLHAPIIRAKHLFRSKQLNCISPTDGSTDPFPFATIQSLPLNLAKAYIFSKQGGPVYSDLKELKGLNIGVRKGLEFGGKLDQYPLNIEPVWDTEQNYKKLLSGRIDAFIAYVPDLWGYFGSQHIPQLAYNKSKPILVYQESVACHDTPENRAFIKQLNTALQQLQQQGVIKDLLGFAYNLD